MSPACRTATGSCATPRDGRTPTRFASLWPGVGRGTQSRNLVVVNLSAPAPAQARVSSVPWADPLRGQQWQLTDRLSGESFAREGDELAGQDGSYVGLDGWASHFLEFR